MTERNTRQNEHYMRSTNGQMRRTPAGSEGQVRRASAGYAGSRAASGMRQQNSSGSRAASGMRQQSSSGSRTASGRTDSGARHQSAGARRYSEAEAYERRQRPSRRRRKKKNHGGLIAAIIIIVVILAVGFFVLKSGILKKEVVEEIHKPQVAYPEVVETTTVAATGDILLHTPILDSCWVGEDTYDFSGIFSTVSGYYQEPDVMVANLEVPLGGAELGYSSYPFFNSPDSIAYALRDAGVDVCLTANNHAGDAGYDAMMRTLSVLDDCGLGHLGTRATTDEPYIMTKMVNGIKLGMICYTYDTREETGWEKSLNGIPLYEDGPEKVNSFSYEALDEFYADAQRQIDYMDMLGVDAKIFFMHWGSEYMDYSTDIQDIMAQKLCDMGVDVIIGGHPHVVEQFDYLTSDNGNETICLYSTGNEISNQRRDLMIAEDGGRGYTEDGIIFEVTFEKFNNGKVKIAAVDAIPTWVQLDDWGYRIIGMPEGEDPWSWGANDTWAAIESYNRTMGRLGSEYLEYRTKKGQDDIVTFIE